MEYKNSTEYSEFKLAYWEKIMLDKEGKADIAFIKTHKRVAETDRSEVISYLLNAVEKWYNQNRYTSLSIKDIYKLFDSFVKESNKVLGGNREFDQTSINHGMNRFTDIGGFVRFLYPKAKSFLYGFDMDLIKMGDDGFKWWRKNNLYLKQFQPTILDETKKEEPKKGTIDLGDKVKDIITGFEGIVIAKSLWAYNATTFGVQKQTIGSSGVVDAAQFFDAHRLEMISKGELASIVVPPADPKFHFLDKVKETMTGKVGTVSGMTIWISGCIKISITLPELNKDNYPIDLWCSQEQAELIEKKEKKSETTTGGPMNHLKVY